MPYQQEDVYIAFCGSFHSEEMGKKLKVELVRAEHVGTDATLFREIAGRPSGSGAWFSWASAGPLDVSILRQMAEPETRALVFALEGVPLVGLPEERIRRREEERCTIFLREGLPAPSADPRIVRLEERHIPLLDGLFDHPEVTEYQREVYRSAYENVIRAEDTEEFKGAVYGFVSVGCLLSALQVSTEVYPSIRFRRNRLINPFTRPDRRGQGLGKAVMSHALGLFPRETVTYEYDGENETALRLAGACGFRPVLNVDLYEVELQG